MMTSWSKAASGSTSNSLTSTGSITKAACTIRAVFFLFSGNQIDTREVTGPIHLTLVEKSLLAVESRALKPSSQASGGITDSIAFFSACSPVPGRA